MKRGRGGWAPNSLPPCAASRQFAGSAKKDCGGCKSTSLETKSWLRDQWAAHEGCFLAYDSYLNTWCRPTEESSLDPPQYAHLLTTCEYFGFEYHCITLTAPLREGGTCETPTLLPHPSYFQVEWHIFQNCLRVYAPVED